MATGQEWGVRSGGARSLSPQSMWEHRAFHVAPLKGVWVLKGLSGWVQG